MATRSLENAKAWMRDRLGKRIHPLGLTEPTATLQTIEALEGLDGENWAAAWMATGDRFLKRGTESEAAGDLKAAQDAYYQAYGFYFLGRSLSQPSRQGSELSPRAKRLRKVRRAGGAADRADDHSL